MSAMTERVAEAIERAMASDDNAPEDIARAAIAAMKSPTGAMVEAGAQGSKAQWGDHRDGKDGAERCWALMIDSALGSESP